MTRYVCVFFSVLTFVVRFEEAIFETWATVTFQWWLMSLAHEEHIMSLQFLYSLVRIIVKLLRRRNIEHDYSIHCCS